MTVDPLGRFLYCLSDDSAGKRSLILVYRIGPGGRLRPSPRRVILALEPPSKLFAHPNGRLVYGLTKNAVTMYQVQSNGSLHLSGAVVTSAEELGDMALDPSGRYAYLAIRSKNAIRQYRVGETRWIPTGSDAPGRQPISLAASPTHPFLYAISDAKGRNPLLVYRIRPDGTLSAVASPPCLVQFRLYIDPTGRYLYGTETGGSDSPGDIAQFRLSPDGLPSPLTPPSFEAGLEPVSAAIVQH